MDAQREATALYALGALSGPQADGFAAHLRECPVCAAEVRTFVGVAAALALSAELPPTERIAPHVRERILRVAQQR